MEGLLSIRWERNKEKEIVMKVGKRLEEAAHSSIRTNGKQTQENNRRQTGSNELLMSENKMMIMVVSL